MPVSFRVDRERGLVFTTFEGGISTEDLQRHAAALANDPDARSCDELADLSGITGASADTEDVRTMARRLLDIDSNRPGGRFAIVAPTDATFGMARLYQAHRDHPDVEIRVFRDYEEALAWLLGR